MFNIFKKRNSSDETDDEQSYEEAVLVTLNNIDNNNDLFKVVKTLEEDLRGVIPENAEVDGHDIAVDGSDAIIYLYGPKADEIFKAIEPTLKKLDIGKIDITLQYGLPDDPKTIDKKFSL